MNKVFPLPADRIVLKSKKDTYTKEVLFRGYQYNVNGKPQVSKFLIGKTTDGKTFIPNANYYEIFDENNNPFPIDKDIYIREMKKFDSILEKSRKSQTPVRLKVSRMDFLIKVIKETAKKLQREASATTEELDYVVNPAELVKSVDVETATPEEILNDTSSPNAYLDTVYKIVNSLEHTRILGEVWSKKTAISVTNWVAYTILKDTYNAAQNFNLFAEEMNLASEYHLSSQRCSELFKSLSEDKQEEFFKAWADLLQEEEAVYIDFSNITTYSNNLELADYGHSKSGEKLKQINILVCKGVKTNMPILIEAYRGNLHDSTWFKNAIKATVTCAPKVKMVIM
ncbi:hypothetical protein CKF54_04550, partial [Psittacicella hinzii]